MPLTLLEVKQNKKYRNMLIGFLAGSILLSFTPLAQGLIYLIPAAGFMMGWYMKRRSRVHYITLVLWLFFLAPMVRRMIEYHLQAQTAAMVIATPILACVAGMPTLRRLQIILSSVRLRSVVLIVATMVYAAVVGFLTHSPFGMVQELVTWVGPLAFALYLFDQREYLEEILSLVRNNFLFGILTMGLYGVYQYLVLAPWDAYWMENSSLSTIGSPERMQVRVFSTMNAPQTLADFLIFGLLLCVSSTRKLRYTAMPLALMSLALTSSRSAWVGGAAGMLFAVFSLPAKRRIQIAFTLFGCIALMGVLTQIPEVDELLTARLSSFTNLKEDSSVNQRLASQQQAITMFLAKPFGNGFGGSGASEGGSGPSYGVATIQGVYQNDNGIEQVTLTYGWAGSLVFIFGFATAVTAALRVSGTTDLMALKAGLISLVVQVPTMGIFPSATGMLLWVSIILCLATQELQATAPLYSGAALQFHPVEPQEAS